MATDYKTLKETFVSGMSGSSIGHINMISLVAFSSIALHSALTTRLSFSKSITFPLELVILVVPLLLSITLSANSPGLLNLILLLPTVLLLLLPRRESGTPLPSNASQSRSSSPSRERDQARGNGTTRGAAISQLAPLTTYRSHMLLLTFLCILAVDFPVFPRFLAKCETIGVSLMDLGVGSFVFSQGIVSAAPLIRDPAYLTQPSVRKVLTVVRKCLPLFVLGFLRTLSVKGVEYPEHQTEYGVHWNFFITLATIPVLQVLLHPLILRFPIALLGVLIALLQQTVLKGGLMEYVLNAPRITLVSSNKEGLVSLMGYLSIHILGLSTGTLVLPPSPSHFRRRLLEVAHPRSRPQSGRARTHDYSDSDSDDDSRTRKPAIESPVQVLAKRENDKTAIELCSYAVLWWVFLGVLKILDVGGGVSRRLVNLQYIIWVVAFNTSSLLGYLFLDLMFFASPSSKSIYSPVSKLKVRPDPVVLTKPNGRPGEVGGRAPPLLDAINRNGLVLFLLANVSTGLVNLSMPTMYMPDWASMLVLSLYALAMCSVAWGFRQERLWTF